EKSGLEKRSRGLQAGRYHMPVGFANGTPFKIPLTSSVGSSGAADGSSGTSGAAAASAPAGVSGPASELVVTKTYVGGDDDSVVFHNFTSGSIEVSGSSTHVVDTAPFGVNASVFNAHSADTLVGAPWDGHFLFVTSDWDL